MVGSGGNGLAEAVPNSVAGVEAGVLLAIAGTVEAAADSAEAARAGPCRILAARQASHLSQRAKNAPDNLSRAADEEPRDGGGVIIIASPAAKWRQPTPTPEFYSSSRSSNQNGSGRRFGL